MSRRRLWYGRRLRNERHSLHSSCVRRADRPGTQPACVRGHDRHPLGLRRRSPSIARVAFDRRMETGRRKTGGIGRGLRCHEVIFIGTSRRLEGFCFLCSLCAQMASVRVNGLAGSINVSHRIRTIFNSLGFPRYAGLPLHGITRIVLRISSHRHPGADGLSGGSTWSSSRQGRWSETLTSSLPSSGCGRRWHHSRCRISLCRLFWFRLISLTSRCRCRRVLPLALVRFPTATRLRRRGLRVLSWYTFSRDGEMIQGRLAGHDAVVEVIKVNRC